MRASLAATTIHREIDMRNAGVRPPEFQWRRLPYLLLQPFGMQDSGSPVTHAGPDTKFNRVRNVV